MLAALSSQGLSTIYVAFVNLGVTLFIANGLGPNSFGVYSYVLAFSSLVATLQDGGFKTLLVREKVSVSNKLKGSAALLPHYAFGTNLLITGLTMLTIWVLPVKDKEVLLAAVLCSSLIVFSQTVSAIFRGEGHFGRDAAWQITFRSVTAISIIFLGVIYALTPLSIFLYLAGGSVFALALVSRQALKSPKIPACWATCREVLPLALVCLSTTIYFKADVVMLGYLLDDSSQAGYYSAAYKFLEVIVFLLAPISYICFNLLRESWRDGNYFRVLLRWMVGLMLLCALVSFLLVNWLGPWLIEITFGAAYRVSVDLLLWLSLSLFFIMPNYILTQAAIAREKSSNYALITVVTAVSNIGMNLYLIPRFGAVGAAWATIIAEALMFGLLILVLRDYLFTTSRSI